MNRKVWLPFVLAYIAVASFMVALYSCAGCGSSPLALGRTVAQEYEAVVEVDVSCTDDGPLISSITTWHGSGVVVSSSQVLTAWHVVDAAAVTGANCNIAVVLKSGEHVPMTVEVSAVENDMARLDTLELYVFNAPPVELVSPPDPGQWVCAVVAWPERGRRCGEVQDRRDPDGKFWYDIITEPGNSGGGVYDTSGHLVGIVSSYRPCPFNGQLCGGGAMPLVEAKFLLPVIL